MQHDLKWHERRAVEGPNLTGWCICGGWTYQSANLLQAPMIDGFMEHLDEIKPYVEWELKYRIDEDGAFADKPY